MSNEYYLVPFGREPGGYFDVLGLPPNAPDKDVGKRSNEYIQSHKNEAKKQCAALAERQKKNEITQEECEAEIGVIKAALEKHLTELNKLKEIYTAALAQARKLKQGGYEAEPPGWVEMASGLDGDPDKLWELLSKRRSLPRVSEDLLLRIEQRWVNTGEALPSGRGYAAPQAQPQQRQPLHCADGVDFPDLPSGQAGQGPPANLAAVSRLITERDLIRLLWADKLWARLSGTNRDYWQCQLQAWLTEIEQIGPHFRHRAESGAVQSNRDYPHLSEPRQLTIDHLEEDPADDAVQDVGRRRPASEQAFDLQKFLESMEPAELGRFLASLGGGSENSGNDARPPAPGGKPDGRF
jgi:hypothetical protein